LFISKTLYVIILKKLSEKKLSEKYKRKSRDTDEYKTYFHNNCYKTPYSCIKNFKKGRNFSSGKVAYKIYPDIIKVISKDFKIIMVTGTNGKTTIPV